MPKATKPGRPGDLIFAAGGVVERPTPSGSEVLVILRRRYGEEWCLPKGKPEPGEAMADAALREVHEETGLRVTLVDFLGVTQYRVEGTPKIVIYWRMRPAGEAQDFTPSEEVERFEWLGPDEAIARLTHADEKDMVRALPS